METKTQKLSESQLEVEVTFSQEEFDEFFDRALFELGKDLEIKGFRKGKVPKEILQEELDLEQVLSKAGEMAIKEAYQKLVLEKNIELIARPEVVIKKVAKGSPFVFSMKIQLIPEIELPDYTKIASSTKFREIVVEEKEVEDSLRWLQRSRAKFKDKKAPAEKGNFVEIEYSSPSFREMGIKRDGFILGEGHFIPGFEEKLVGMKPGEEKRDIEVNLPERQNQPVSGKIFINVKMKGVKEVEFPEINDDFARSLGRFKDLQNLKDSIRSGIREEKKEAERLRVREEILEKISKETKFEIPEVLVEREQAQMLENLKKNVSEKLNLSFEDYLKSIKTKEEDLKKMFYEKARANVKKLLILREIAKKENINVDEAELQEEVNKILREYSSPEEAREKIGLDPKALKEYTKEAIKHEKVMRLLESLAQGSKI